MIEWKRAKRDETDISNRRRWFSRCGRYEVTEAVSKFEFKDDGKPMVYYYAIFLDLLIKRHKLKHKAEESCEKHNKKRTA